MDHLPVYSIKEFNSEEIQLYVNDLNEHLTKHHFIHTPHKHDFYLCVLFVKGTGIHEIDFQSYDIQPGSVFFLNPGQFHNWIFDSKVEGYIFFHSREFYDLNYQNRQLENFPFYFSEYNSPVVYLDEPGIIEMSTSFQQIIQEWKSDEAFKLSKICSLIDLMYIQCARQYIPRNEIKSVTPSYSLKLRQFEQLVKSNFREYKMPNDYAEMMNMTNKHLNRIVKETLNKTVSIVIADRIILEAKRLLIHSDHRVVEVAEKVGFSDDAYFNRYFKKHTNQTPMEFAKGYRK